MKIGLIYYAPCDLAEVAKNPKDQTAAAVCFLAIQLAKLGHAVTIFSQSPNADIFNVRCRQMEITERGLRVDPALTEKDFETLIFKDAQIELVAGLKKSLGYKPKTYLWTSLLASDPHNAGLHDSALAQHIDKVVCVSDWQRVTLYDYFDLPKDKFAVVQYAIAPMFAKLFVDAKDFLQVKSKTPCIAFLADTDDGLDILLDSFDDITGNYQNVQLGIFTPITDLDLRDRIASNRYIKLYDEMTITQLATTLREYTIFANPEVKPLTYNVNIMQTMAAGLYTVTSDIAANNDYCVGHGNRVNEDDLRANSLDNFLSAVLSVCQSQTHYASEFYDVCFKQTIDMNNKQTWEARAITWLELMVHS